MPGRRSPPTPCSESPQWCKQRVDQRARLMRRRRMHDHPRRLVDHDEVRVLEQDGERDVLGLILDGNRRRREEHDALVRAHLARRRRHRLTADGDLALLDAPADLRARPGQTLLRQPHVETLARFRGSDGEFVFFGGAQDCEDYQILDLTCPLDLIMTSMIARSYKFS